MSKAINNALKKKKPKAKPKPGGKAKLLNNRVKKSAGHIPLDAKDMRKFQAHHKTTDVHELLARQITDHYHKAGLHKYDPRHIGKAIGHLNHHYGPAVGEHLMTTGGILPYHGAVHHVTNGDVKVGGSVGDFFKGIGEGIADTAKAGFEAAKDTVETAGKLAMAPANVALNVAKAGVKLATGDTYGAGDAMKDAGRVAYEDTPAKMVVETGKRVVDDVKNAPGEMKQAFNDLKSGNISGAIEHATYLPRQLHDEARPFLIMAEPLLAPAYGVTDALDLKAFDYGNNLRKLTSPEHLKSHAGDVAKSVAISIAAEGLGAAAGTAGKAGATKAATKAGLSAETTAMVGKLAGKTAQGTMKTAAYTAGHLKAQGAPNEHIAAAVKYNLGQAGAAAMMGASLSAVGIDPNAAAVYGQMSGAKVPGRYYLGRDATTIDHALMNKTAEQYFDPLRPQAFKDPDGNIKWYNSKTGDAAGRLMSGDRLRDLREGWAEANMPTGQASSFMEKMRVASRHKGDFNHYQNAMDIALSEYNIGDGGMDPQARAKQLLGVPEDLENREEIKAAAEAGKLHLQEQHQAMDRPPEGDFYQTMYRAALGNKAAVKAAGERFKSDPVRPKMRDGEHERIRGDLQYTGTNFAEDGTYTDVTGTQRTLDPGMTRGDALLKMRDVSRKEMADDIQRRGRQGMKDALSGAMDRLNRFGSGGDAREVPNAIPPPAPVQPTMTAAELEEYLNQSGGVDDDTSEIQMRPRRPRAQAQAAEPDLPPGIGLGDVNHPVYADRDRSNVVQLQRSGLRSAQPYIGPEEEPDDYVLNYTQVGPRRRQPGAQRRRVTPLQPDPRRPVDVAEDAQDPVRTQGPPVIESAREARKQARLAGRKRKAEAPKSEQRIENDADDLRRAKRENLAAQRRKAVKEGTKGTLADFDEIAKLESKRTLTEDEKANYQQALDTQYDRVQDAMAGARMEAVEMALDSQYGRIRDKMKDMRFQAQYTPRSVLQQQAAGSLKNPSHGSLQPPDHMTQDPVRAYNQRFAEARGRPGGAQDQENFDNLVGTGNYRPAPVFPRPPPISAAIMIPYEQGGGDYLLDGYSTVRHGERVRSEVRGPGQIPTLGHAPYQSIAALNPRPRSSLPFTISPATHAHRMAQEAALGRVIRPSGLTVPRETRRQKRLRNQVSSQQRQHDARRRNQLRRRDAYESAQEYARTANDLWDRTFATEKAEAAARRNKKYTYAPRP